MAMCKLSTSPVMDGQKESSASLRTALPTRPVSTKDESESCRRTESVQSEDDHAARDGPSSPLSSRTTVSRSPMPSLSPEAASDVVKPAAGQICQYVPLTPCPTSNKKADLILATAVRAKHHSGGDLQQALPSATPVVYTRSPGTPLDPLT